MRTLLKRLTARTGPSSRPLEPGQRYFHPRLEDLEDRLPPSDVLLGNLTTDAFTNTQAAAEKRQLLDAANANQSLAPGSTVARVNGGGKAEYIPTPHSVLTEGFTNFSVSVTVFANGSAQGHWVCMAAGAFVISGDVHNGTLNENGSVTVTGLGHGYDHAAGQFENLPFMVTLYAGGPNEGRFDYWDASGFFGEGQYDTEVVRHGMIRINA